MRQTQHRLTGNHPTRCLGKLQKGIFQMEAVEETYSALTIATAVATLRMLPKKPQNQAQTLQEKRTRIKELAWLHAIKLEKLRLELAADLRTHKGVDKVLRALLFMEREYQRHAA